MDERASRPALSDPKHSGGPAPRRGFFSLRTLVIAIVILLVVGLLVWVLMPRATQPTGRGGRFGQNTPMPVVTAAAKTGDMPVALNGLGTVTPLATVTVKTQISGYLTQIAFTEGQLVKEGDFLAQIDPRPYQVVLEQAEGTLAHDQALLADAKLDLTRYEKLVAQDSIAEQQRDTQQALVKQYEGTVKADQGQVDGAKLNLTYCHIVAPVGGRVGLRQVDQGNYVTPGDANGIVVITQLQPITVVFTLPEDSIPQTVKRLHGGATLPVTAWDRAHVTKLADGSLASIDNQIDVTTGTVKLKANFPNTDESLFPNQFVNSELLLDTMHDALLVPQSAILRGAPGTFVYLVDTEKKTVSVRVVKLGPGDANNIAITSGLEPGDQVVVDGADKLKDGAAVALPEAADGQTRPARPHGQGDGQGQNHQQGGQGQQGQGQQGEHHHRRQQDGSQGQGQNQGGQPAPAQ